MSAHRRTSAHTSSQLAPSQAHMLSSLSLPPLSNSVVANSLNTRSNAIAGTTNVKPNNSNNLAASFFGTESVLDTILGTGPASAATALTSDTFGTSSKSGGAKTYSAQKQNSGASGSGGVLVDFMTFAEAPAFFDLPIPLLLARSTAPSGAKITTSSSNATKADANVNDGGLGATTNGDQSNGEYQLSLTMSGDTTSKNNNNTSDKPVTSKFLAPLHDFDTNEQLRLLDVGNLGGTVATTSTVGASNGNASGNDLRGNLRRNGRGGGGSRNTLQRGTKKHGMKQQAGSSTLGAQQQQQPPAMSRIVLPKCIADMVQSLRPTHYGPLRKAMRARSQERFFEGDEKEPDEETKRRMELEQERQRAQVASNVVEWQTTNSATIAAADSQPANESRGSSSRGARPDVPITLRVPTMERPFSTQSQTENEPNPIPPHSHPHQFGAAYSAMGVPPQLTSSSLSTIHAGRRPSIATAPMVGDLGSLERPLPTHGRAPLLREHDNAENDDAADYGSANNSTGRHHAHLPLHPTPSSHFGSLPRIGSRQSHLAASNENAQRSELCEPTTLLASASPYRTGAGRPRLSVANITAAQSKSPERTDEFHRDILAWYRTEATMLRVAM